VEMPVECGVRNGRRQIISQSADLTVSRRKHSPARSRQDVWPSIFLVPDYQRFFITFFPTPSLLRPACANSSESPAPFL
jgi:hypothetical protein